jgi:serine O-acetyltransferase
MHQALIQTIFNKQAGIEPVPSNKQIAEWASVLLCALYPEKADCSFESPLAIEQRFLELQHQFTNLLQATKACNHCVKAAVAEQFFSQLPGLYQKLNGDVQAILSGDPAAQTEFEIIRAYPGFTAISFYRIAHALHSLQVPILPRILSEHAHAQTGIDIHPAAHIGEHFFIDHGTGIVIGETTHIGNHVKLYQGVTLGALSVQKSLANTKRHPTVEDHVVIYSGATILGGDTVIGHHSVIGGNVWLTKSVAPYSTVYHTPEITVISNQEPVL